MARAAFDPIKHLQVFRGSRQPLGVYAKHAGDGCCATGYTVHLDRLADVVHGPNVYSHLKPTTFNEKFMFPLGPVGGSIDNDIGLITNHINANGVGAKIGIILIPNYAYITDVSVHVFAEEPGLTFDLVTRNGLALPSKKVTTIKTSRSEDNACELTRTVKAAGADDKPYEGIGALDGNAFVDIFARDADGVFTADPDEVMLVVKSMPTDKRVIGTFRMTVAVNYSVCDRAERE